jgi:hypothetical protein
LPANQELLTYLRGLAEAYEFDIAAIYRRHGEHGWPLTAGSADELERRLRDGGHFLPLPKEPAALANVLEVSLIDYLLEAFEDLDGASAQRGTERGYPDLEIAGAAFGDGFHALDVKVARRARGERRTQSRITLYTGNTYFRYPQLRWPGTFRAFQDYESHLDLIALYTLDESSLARMRDLELLVHEPWKIASRQRSSTTREYLGAVQ